MCAMMYVCVHGAVRTDSMFTCEMRAQMCECMPCLGLVFMPIPCYDSLVCALCFEQVSCRVHGLSTMDERCARIHLLVRDLVRLLCGLVYAFDCMLDDA